MRFSRFFFISSFFCLALSASSQEYVPGEVLVKFDAGTPVFNRFEAEVIGARIVEEIPAIGVSRIVLPKGYSVDEGVRYFKGSATVKFAEPNYIAKAHVNDTYYTPSIQWGLFKVNADGAWAVTTGSSSIRVAVLDTGYDTTHPDLASKVDTSVCWDYVANDSVPEDKNGHGSHTAGTVGAATNNGIGVASIGYNTRLVIIKVLNNRGSGTYANIAAGIRRAADTAGVKAINMSLGGSAGSSTLQSAVDYAWGKGCVVVASAGNSGSSAPNYPAYYSNCIAVASTDSNDAKSSFSQYGSWVDVAAPGSSIASTYKQGGYVYMSGTSMAAPHISGIAGLCAARGFSNSAIRTRIQGSGPIVPGHAFRRVDAVAAVQ